MRPSWYTANYCEENVWRLLQDKAVDATQRHAVFISNARRACPVWMQATAPAEGEPVLWDYHVVMLARCAGWHVFDLDSKLPLPCPAVDYLGHSFPLFNELEDEWQPHFRVVTVEDMVSNFASDRSHMVTSEGDWSSPPPPFDCIRTATETMNLQRFVDVESPFLGRLFSLPELVQWLVKETALSS